LYKDEENFLLYKQDTKNHQAGRFSEGLLPGDHYQIHTEEGLLGVQADPDFAKNHFIYAYYSPVDSSVDRLSRLPLIMIHWSFLRRKSFFRFMSKEKFVVTREARLLSERTMSFFYQLATTPHLLTNQGNLPLT